MSPVGICLLLAIAGLLTYKFTKLKKVGKLIFALSPMLLFLFSLPLIGNSVVISLENNYSPLSETTLDKTPEYIVVLGCGEYRVKPDSSVNTNINACFWARLSEGIRLAKALPDTNILLSLPSVNELGLEQEALDQFSEETEIDRDRLILLTAKDTGGEAKAAKEILEDPKCILVTAAFHMARAVIQFQREGITVIPAPSDYIYHAPQAGINLYHFFPSARSLYNMQICIKEYIAIVYLKLTS